MGVNPVPWTGKQFRSGGVRYEDGGRGNLQLVPTGALPMQLRNDFQKMQASGMFLAEPPQFNAITLDATPSAGLRFESFTTHHVLNSVSRSSIAHLTQVGDGFGMHPGWRHGS